MSQLLLLEFNLKDQAAVTTFRKIVSSRHDKMIAFGGTLLSTYVDQDDSNHLFHMIEWTSCVHHAAYMKWGSTQPDHEKLVACLVIPPRFTWLDKLAR